MTPAILALAMAAPAAADPDADAAVAVAVAVRRLDAATPLGAYEFASYDALKRFVESDKPDRGFCPVLAVGASNPWKHSYRRSCSVPSGYGGLADGLYDCWWDGTKAVIAAHAVPTPIAPPAVIPAAVARPATFTIPAPAVGPGCYTINGKTYCPYQR